MLQGIVNIELNEVLTHFIQLISICSVNDY
jgi:hypothetical protein